LTTLARAQAEGRLEDRLAFYAKPKLLIADEVGLPAVRAGCGAPVLPAGFEALRARQPDDHQQPSVGEWGTVFGCKSAWNS
jgi:hypothetical protein